MLQYHSLSFSLFLSLYNTKCHPFFVSYLSSALEKLAPRTVSYEEQSTALREQLASVYQSQEEWSKAAQTLAGIDLESGMRVIDPEYKLGMCVKIAMLYLEDEDAVGAETFIKRASSLLSSCTNEELELQYKSCYARLLDSKRRFLEAATRYFELSQVGHKLIEGGRRLDEGDVMKALSAAITCTILASAGPQRSRMLATLYKDERTSRLPILHPFLEKVYMERILKAEEVENFAMSLAPHQLARLPDGSTVIERSVMEHNLEAASKLYSRIYISELAALLGIPDRDKIEKAAGKMISENRLQGKLDQVDGVITFGEGINSLELKDKVIMNLCRTADSALNNAIARGLVS